MTGTTLTDIVVARMIRRILANPSTTTDTLLIFADALDEAATASNDATAAAILRGHATDLRELAPRLLRAEASA